MSVPAVRQVAAPAAKRGRSAQSSLSAVEDAQATAGASPSPARILQEQLQSNLSAAAVAGEIQEKRWPLYTALTFWGGVSSLMWAAIIGCVWILLRHI
jgi:hypothetical protein